MTDPKTRSLFLMKGGPLYRIERRIGLIRLNSDQTIAVALTAALSTWFVLLALSALQEHALGHSVTLSFLKDFSAYTRFLLATPLFIVAEMILGPRLAEAAAHFIESGLIEESDFGNFDQAIERTLELRDSHIAEVVIAIAAVLISIYTFQATGLHVSTWYSIPSAAGNSTTWAGWWLMLYCMPLLNFLILRWLWRLYLWFRFLGSMRNLNIQLFATHPDEAGGLGFVGDAQRFFGIIPFTYSIAITGIIANLSVFDKIPLEHFVPVICAYVIVTLLVLTLPLALFTPKLVRTRQKGLYEYGSLATAYASDFHKKWINSVNPKRDELLGTSDVQSLSDMAGSYEVVENIKIIPMNFRTLLHLVLVCVIPMLPLLLTVMSLKDLFKLLLKFVM